MNLWTSGPHPYVIALTQTIFKVLTAVVSCATAVLLVSIIPQVLHIKVRRKQVCVCACACVSVCVCVCVCVCRP